MITMSDDFTQKTEAFLKSLNLEVRDTNEKDEIKKAKSIIATFNPSKMMIIKNI